MKTRLAITAVLSHLGLALLAPLSLTPGSPARPLARWLHAYASLTGASADFKFFAPTVGSPIEAEFELVDKHGQVRVEQLAVTNRETALRIGNIVDAFGEELADKNLRQNIAASLATFKTAGRSDLRSIIVRLRQYDVPSLADFRAGSAAHWQTLYEANFALNEASL